jgi:hypothetical protein
MRYLLLWLGLVGFYGFFGHGYLENTDADVTMHAARALYLRGDPGLMAEGPDTWRAERAIAGPEPGIPVFGKTGTNGKLYVWFPIGHQLLMVPCVALGELFDRWFPEVQADYEQRIRNELFNQFYWSRFFVSFLPALAAAGSTVMLLLLARALGCTMRSSLIIAAVVSLCTQMWPACSETLSDGPGMFFLLAVAVLVFRWCTGAGTTRSAVLAGACGGIAVLLRYQHALPVLVLALVMLRASWPARAKSAIAGLGLGAAPAVALLLAANWLRFGNLLETGYSAGATADFWSYPAYLGVPSILIAPGKGILWFSPLLLAALPAFCHRGVLRFPFLPVAVIFALSLLLHGCTIGWAAGQCWGIRYLTPAVALVCTVALARLGSGRRWPRRFIATAALGFVVSLGGIVTPYRGQQDLAYKAATVLYPGAPQLDNNVNADPRLTPLHTHWIYLWLSLSGRLEQRGPENTTGPLFGVYELPSNVGLDRPGEDAGLRHWWMVSFADRQLLPLWPTLVPWVAVTLALLAGGVRALLRDERSSVPAAAAAAS